MPTPATGGHPRGVEYQVLDDDRHADGGDPKTSAAAVYAVVAPVGKPHAPPGTWRRGRIVVRNSGTEPVIRVMGEADDEALVQTVVDDVAACIEGAV